MIDEEFKNIIEEESRVGEFIYPSYEKYCFSNIPSTILKFFNIKTRRPSLPPKIYRNRVEYEDSKKIILLLIDGYGYNQWLECHKKYKFLKEISQNGVISPITTVFPSTTAAALTTINTGLTPQEHALPEWHIYFEEIDMIINTLPFTPLGDKGQDRLLEMGVNPKILYNGNTIYQTLKNESVKSYTFIKASYAHSCYSKIVHEGSTIVPFITYSDMFTKLRKIVKEEKGPAYFYAYLDNLDAIGHLYGPHTMEYFAELSALSYSIKTELLEKIGRKETKQTLLLITSDHGQVGISPEDTIYLNEFQKLTHALKRSKKGKPILPTGSARDVFLHIEPTKLEGTYNFLSKKLQRKAKVMKTIDATEIGLFGIGKPRKRFFERVGDLLVLPYNKHTVWYEHMKGKKMYFLGCHGGLSRDEMFVPFAMAKLSELL